MTPSDRLADQGLALPAVAAPVGSYLPAIKFGQQVFTSGQLPIKDGKLTCVGKVGSQTTVEDAAAGAQLAALNALAAAAQVAGGLDKIARILRVGVFVNSGEGFTAQPSVANGASDFLVSLFGDAGRHVRAAVGVNELPLDAAVELELHVATH